MSKQEWVRLKGYWLANKTSKNHQPTLQGRSISKGRASGYGLILEKSFVKSMSVETQHFQRKQY